MNRTATIAFAALLAISASPAAAQKAIVYTNLNDDGQRVAGVVKVVRDRRPSAPVPPSITTTPVAPLRAWRLEMGGTGYVPTPVPVTSAPARKVAPLFVDGIYRGPSPSGRWMSITHGRPVIDVHLVGRTR